MSVIHVDMVDTSPASLLGLKEIFESANITVVAARSQPPDTVSHGTDVLIIDLEALRPLGSAAIQYVTEAVKKTSVVIMTNEPVHTSPSTYLAIGAAGVISKYEIPEILVKTIRQVAAAREGGGAVTQPRAEDRDGGRRPVLSMRENQVLRYLSYGLTHQQVAHQLQISRHTVDTYVTRLRTKLGVSNKAELTRVSVLRQLQPSPDQPGPPTLRPPVPAPGRDRGAEASG
jgi:DNA-binding NarL/FixJ family response regulator